MVGNANRTYKSAKRSKELKRLKKQEEKRLKRLQRKDGTGGEGEAELEIEAVEGGTAEGETPETVEEGKPEEET